MESLYWQFDISTFRLLGRELITDRITALFELVKNSYDANSTSVEIIFTDVTYPTANSKIILKDNGVGMSANDVKTKWMMVGSNSKRSTRTSPEPFKRKLVGKKGIGRFAVDKLGSRLVLKSKKKGEREYSCLEINWKLYEENSINNDLKNADLLFTSIPNSFWTEEADEDLSGTILEITDVRDPWSYFDIERAERELAKIVSPINKLNIYSFDIFITSEECNKLNEKIQNQSIHYASLELNVRSKYQENIQEVLKFKGDELVVVEEPIKSFGPVNMVIYYFDEEAKYLFKKNTIGSSIDGLKIYRDGIIATPFAEFESNDLKKRDILNIDKRRYSGFFDKISSKDILGFIDISDELNPLIIDSTNRQDFVDNHAYRDLKNFIIAQLHEIEQYLKRKKDTVRGLVKSELIEAKKSINIIYSGIYSLEKNAKANQKVILDDVKRQVSSLENEIKKGVIQYQKLEEEKVKQQNLFFSLMSMQDYSLELAHTVNIGISSVLSKAEFFIDFFPNDSYENLFKEYSSEIYNGMKRLQTAVEFLLSYAKSNIDFETFSLKQLIENLTSVYHYDQLEKNKINVIIEFNKDVLVTHNKRFILDIFENLLTNSIKALVNTENKYIKITVEVLEKECVILFSDNGYGISDNIKDEIFGIYFTTTADQGGAGVGLYTVKKRIEALKGSIKVISSEFKPIGATFKIVLPFSS